MEMSNRYKNQILYPKGVLEGNWFEEEQRRKEAYGMVDSTQNFSPQMNQTNKYTMPVYPKDDFDRYDTVNHTYGNFFNLNEERNPKTLALKKQYEQESLEMKQNLNEENEVKQVMNELLNNIENINLINSLQNSKISESEINKIIQRQQNDIYILLNYKKRKN